MRFTDDKRREWRVSLDGPKLRELRARGIDLFSADAIDSPATLVDCLWWLCRGQRPEVTAEDFGGSLVKSIGDAQEALLHAVVDFLPTQRQLEAVAPADSGEGDGDSAFDWAAWCYSTAGYIGVSPHGLTAAELFSMLTGKCQIERADNVALASLVWAADKVDVAEYVRCGQMQTAKPRNLSLTAEQRAAVDAKISEVMATGKLIVGVAA